MKTFEEQLIDQLEERNELYKKRLNPTTDSETGATVDEIDRLEFQIEQERANHRATKSYFNKKVVELEDRTREINLELLESLKELLHSFDFSPGITAIISKETVEKARAIVEKAGEL